MKTAAQPNLILSNMARGTHAMTLIGGGFVATSQQALLCAFAMHPFDDPPRVRRRLVRQVWRRARTHGLASRYASGDALVDQAAAAVADYWALAHRLGEKDYAERCSSVLAAAVFDGSTTATMHYLTQDERTPATSVPAPGSQALLLLPSA